MIDRFLTLLCIEVKSVVDEYKSLLKRIPTRKNTQWSSSQSSAQTGMKTARSTFGLPKSPEYDHMVRMGSNSSTRKNGIRTYRKPQSTQNVWNFAKLGIGKSQSQTSLPGFKAARISQSK